MCSWKLFSVFALSDRAPISRFSVNFIETSTQKPNWGSDIFVRSTSLRRTNLSSFVCLSIFFHRSGIKSNIKATKIRNNLTHPWRAWISSRRARKRNLLMNSKWASAVAWIFSVMLDGRKMCGCWFTLREDEGEEEEEKSSNDFKDPRRREVNGSKMWKLAPRPKKN